MWNLSSTTFLLYLLSVFYYFFKFLLSWTRHRNVRHMTWYRVRNIPAQLCHAPDDSQLFGALVSMHPFAQCTRVSEPFLSYSVMFSFIYKLPLSTSWNSTLKNNSGWVFLLLFLFFGDLNPLFVFPTPSFN